MDQQLDVILLHDISKGFLHTECQIRIRGYGIHIPVESPSQNQDIGFGRQCQEISTPGSQRKFVNLVIVHADSLLRRVVPQRRSYMNAVCFSVLFVRSHTLIFVSFVSFFQYVLPPFQFAPDAAPDLCLHAVSHKSNGQIVVSCQFHNLTNVAFC